MAKRDVAELRKLLEGEVTETLQEFRAADSESVIKKSHADDLRRFEDLVRSLLTSDMEWVPEGPGLPHLNQLVSYFRQPMEVLRQELRDKPDVHAVRRQVERGTKLADSVEQLNKAVLPFLVQAGAVRSTVAAAEYVQELRSAWEIGLSDVQQAKEKAEAVLRAIQDVASTSGLTSSAFTFDEQASAHRFSARIWLCAAGAMAVCLAVLAIYTANDASSQRQARQNAIAMTVAANTRTGAGVNEGLEVIDSLYSLDAGLLTAKLAALSLLLTGLIFTTKNYRAHKHNQVLNEHRRNCLRSFRAFAEGAEDPETKSQVLLQATTAIYSTHPSGYSGNDGDGDGTPKVIEVFRGFGARPRE